MRLLLGATALLAVLSGCGGAGGTATDPPPTSPASVEPAMPLDVGVREAVQAYSDAYLTGRASEAYGMLSQRCRGRWSEADFAAIVEQAGERYGATLPILGFDAHVRGDLARVSYSFPIPALTQKAEPWVLEDGAWREDDC